MNYVLTSKIFRPSLAISIILVLVLTQLPTMRQNIVQAFMPTNARAFLLTLRTSNWTHQSMTRSAIKELDAEFFSITKLTNSMKKAMEQIADSDAAVDDLPQGGGARSLINLLLTSMARIFRAVKSASRITCLR